MKKITRREFLVGAAGMPLLVKEMTISRAKVVRLPSGVKSAVLERGFEEIWGKRRLSSVVKRGDVVGIKVNCLAGRPLSPRPQLIHALVESLVHAGIGRDEIIVFDRSDDDLKKAGFVINRRGGVKVIGINQDYEREVSESGPVGSCYARIVSRQVTKIINVGVLKDHDLAGVSIGLKNFFGVIHNPNKYHMNNCSPYVAHVVNHPWIRKKLILTVIDADIAQFHGGPAYNPRYKWAEKRLYMSDDPVAIDAVGHARIEEVRKKHGLPSLRKDKRYPRYIEDAAGLGLGTADLHRIEIVNA